MYYKPFMIAMKGRLPNVYCKKGKMLNEICITNVSLGYDIVNCLAVMGGVM